MQSSNQKKTSSEKIPLDFVSGAIFAIGTVLGKTWRYTIRDNAPINPFVEQDKGVIFCFWHCQILPITYIFRNIGITAVVSASKDGDRATAVAQRWNHATIRGSSSRNQISVIRQCNRVLAGKRNIAIIPDGPHGPAEKVKPGAATIALMSNAPLYPVTAIPKSCWRLKSWDKFIIPKPFTDISIRIGDPIFPHDFANAGNKVDLLSQRIQKALSL